RLQVRAAQLDLLALVEDVLLQAFPVVVAFHQDLTHELVEIGVRARGNSNADHHQGRENGEQREKTLRQPVVRSAKASRSYVHPPAEAWRSSCPDEGARAFRRAVRAGRATSATAARASCSTPRSPCGSSPALRPSPRATAARCPSRASCAG